MSDLTRMLLDAKGDRTYEEIADRAQARGHKISKGGVAKLMQGRSVAPEESTLAAIAAGLDLDPREVREAAGRQGGELGPWTPTPRSASLTKAQREALDRLIVTIVEQGGQQDGRTPEAEKMTQHRMRVIEDAGPVDMAAHSDEE